MELTHLLNQTRHYTKKKKKKYIEMQKFWCRGLEKYAACL